MLIASGPVGGAPTGGQAGGARVASRLECPYGPAQVKAALLISPYGTLFARRNLDQPCQDGPVAALLVQPILCSVVARLESEWTLMAKVASRQEQLWTSTVTVAAQCSAKYHLLERDPVASACRQIWNLADDQVIRLSGTAVRVFHRGEVI
ncbi:MAG: hypothetical protein HQL95_13140 [Magnetococcales bacterium]|nr:hypothetical protein [Magnetococcales bacterium]